MTEKILVVDDEEKLCKLIKGFLISEGFSVVEAANGIEALKIFESEKPDLIVLDWMLPEVSGIDVCKRVREKCDTPIIMLTAKSEEIDKLLGLELGADDYMTKPFSLRELVARIRAVLRRANKSIEESKEHYITYSEIFIDTERHQVKVGDTEIKLTPTEYKILLTLIEKPGKVFSRLQLLEVLGLNYEGYERSLDTHISNLRKKLEKEGSGQQYIQTVYGTGYKINAEVF